MRKRELKPLPACMKSKEETKRMKIGGEGGERGQEEGGVDGHSCYKRGE